MTKNIRILALLATFVAIISLVFSAGNVNSSALISDEIEPFCLDNTISFNYPFSLEITTVQIKTIVQITHLNYNGIETTDLNNKYKQS